MNLKVLLVAGPLDAETSFEHCHFQRPLEKVVDRLLTFDFVRSIRADGRMRMNNSLTELVRVERPDVTIFVPHTGEFMPEAIDEINCHTTTVGYFFDDMWRVEYSRFWARHFTFVTTSDIFGVRKFHEAGFDNVIFSPFACNETVYVRNTLPKRFDVSFVGQYHPQREWVLSYLTKAGVAVHCRGIGWPGGMVNTSQVVEVINQSRVNLNLSNCVSWDVRYLARINRPLKSTYRAWRDTAQAVRARDRKVVEQMKARHFELSSCGGFQLSYYVEGLERHFVIGKEIAIYTTPEDLVDKVRYYLRHDAEREAVAQAGYERTQRDHTMEQRLRDILQQVGRSRQ
jgi:spore maturation protein CgeB